MQTAGERAIRAATIARLTRLVRRAIRLSASAGRSRRKLALLLVQHLLLCAFVNIDPIVSVFGAELLLRDPALLPLNLLRLGCFQIIGRGPRGTAPVAPADLRPLGIELREPPRQ